MLFQPDDPDGQCFPTDLRADLAKLAHLPPSGSVKPAEVLELGDWLREAEVALGTWGMPALDDDLLTRMPRLRAIFYAGGAVNGSIASQAMWSRGIRLSTAITINSDCTAQLALSQILFGLKLGWHHQLQTRTQRLWRRIPDIPGSHGTRVGIVSVGAVGRRVIELLAPHGVEVLAYDIQPDAELASAFGVRFVGLDQLFAECQVVSIHTPLMPGSEKLITGSLVRSMPPNSVLINTSRGPIIDQPALEATLRSRPDVVALLDVTDPEAPPVDSPLWDLPNAFLTPHIAGAFGQERRRLGAFAIDELKRYLTGQALLGEVAEPGPAPEVPGPARIGRESLTAAK